MSYEPTNWKTGDVVTSAKLNKLENGVANGGVMVVTFIQDGYDEQQQKLIFSADIAYADALQAVMDGKLVVFKDDAFNNGAAIAINSEGTFYAHFVNFGKGEGENWFVKGSVIEYSESDLYIEEINI